MTKGAMSNWRIRMSLTEVVYKIKSDSSVLCAATEKTAEVRIILTLTSWDDATRVAKALVTFIGPESHIGDLLREMNKEFESFEVVKSGKDQTTLRAVTSLDRLCQTGNPVAFALEHFGERAIVGPALIRDGCLTMRLIVTGKVDLASMLADYEKGAKSGRWGEFKLVRIDDFDPEQQIYGAFTEGLTQKQLEVIKTALALGFYNTPRDITLDDLANIFGISKAAVHNRLQAAERKVIAKFFA